MEAPQAPSASLGSARKAADTQQNVVKRYVIPKPAANRAQQQALHLLTLLLNRMQTELMQLMTTPAEGISAFPAGDGSDLTKWHATINGVEDTPYAGLSFKLAFSFPSDYPFHPPEVTFRTPIYHPNVDFSGRICLDILKSKWSAAYNIRTVLLSLQSLLGEPNK